VPAALSGGPGVLLQQLLGSPDLQLVVRSRVIHPHLKGQAVDGFRPSGHAEGHVSPAQLTEGCPSLPVEGGAVSLLGQKQCREVRLLRGHPHEIRSDLHGGLLVLSVAVTGRTVPSAAPWPVAALVGHPVTAGGKPRAEHPGGPVRSSWGKQLPAWFGADRADQIQVPTSGRSTVQLGLCCCWPVLPGLSLSGVHVRGLMASGRCGSR